MITAESAEDFSMRWINAWNSHNVDKIMEHYSEDVEFYSPFIVLLKFNAEGVLRGKSNLKEYFKAGLEKYPDLQFQLHNYFTGINSLCIYYASVNGKFAAEFFVFDNNEKAAQVFCHYTNNTSTY